jgi:hypothetical protein
MKKGYSTRTGIPAMWNSVAATSGVGESQLSCPRYPLIQVTIGLDAQVLEVWLAGDSWGPAHEVS